MRSQQEGEKCQQPTENVSVWLPLVASVITDSETRYKTSINDPAILPRYAILDPELTVGLPPMVTATTGMDALSHAVEAVTNHTYNTPLEDKLAKDAVGLIYHNLLTVYRDGNNLEARQNMQRASFFAGRAFTRGCVGYVHAVGHTLLYGVRMIFVSYLIHSG